MFRIILAGICLCASASCDSPAQSADKQAAAVPVKVAKAVLSPVQRTVEVVGTLYGDEDVTIAAKVPGRVVRTTRDVGDRAADGEILAAIDPRDYELALDQRKLLVSESLSKLGLTEMPPIDYDPKLVPLVERARLMSSNAEAKYQRGKQLFDQKPPLISEQDFADLQTAAKVAGSDADVAILQARSSLAEARSRQSDVELAEQKLADAYIRAPGFVASSLAAATRASADSLSQPSTGPSGRFAVAERLVSVGEYVREGTNMFRLVADSPVKFRAAVPERYLSAVAVGQKVSLRVESQRDAYDGKITRITPQVDPASRTFKVEAVFDNPAGQLHPGSFGRGSIFTRTEDGVTFVPAAALRTFAGVTKVFTIKDGKAVENPVDTGIARDGMVEIIKGLKAPADVIVEGVERLAGGIPVTQDGNPTTSASAPAD